MDPTLAQKIKVRSTDQKINQQLKCYTNRLTEKELHQIDHQDLDHQINIIINLIYKSKVKSTDQNSN